MDVYIVLCFMYFILGLDSWMYSFGVVKDG